jgi:hypothetical protein
VTGREPRNGSIGIPSDTGPGRGDKALADTPAHSSSATDEVGTKEIPIHVGTPEVLRFRSVFELVGPIVAPAGLLTGLLFYFGRVYVSARFRYFGIDASVLSFSTEEYVLMSIQPIFVPLGAILAIGLLALQIHLPLSGWITTRRHLRLLTLLTPAIGLGSLSLLAFGVMGLLRRPVFRTELLVTPLSFAFGTLGLAYTGYLRRKLHAVARPAATLTARSRLVSVSHFVMVAMLVILSVFWAMGDWAEGLGRGRAEALAQNLVNRPGVILYSKDGLGFDPGAGVTAERVTDEDTPYRVRYRGLKLLLRTGSEYFLLPAGWSPSAGVAIVLPRSTAFRVEFTPR